MHLMLSSFRANAQAANALILEGNECRQKGFRAMKGRDVTEGNTTVVKQERRRRQQWSLLLVAYNGTVVKKLFNT